MHTHEIQLNSSEALYVNHIRNTSDGKRPLSFEFWPLMMNEIDSRLLDFMCELTALTSVRKTIS